jgi:hypothetical protein
VAIRKIRPYNLLEISALGISALRCLHSLT